MLGLGMDNVLQNNKSSISLRRVETFCLFVACKYTSTEATVLPCRFSWVWSGMSKVLWNKKSPVSLERYIEATKYAILGWNCKAYALRPSDVLNLKNLKTKWDFKLIFCYHSTLGYEPKIIFANHFAGFFTFDLFDILILIPLIIILVSHVSYLSIPASISQ